MDGLLPIGDLSKELVSQGIGYALFVMSLWYIGRKDQELKDTRQAHKVEIAEKDKLIQSLQESRVQETRVLVEAINENNVASAAVKASLDSLIPVIQSRITRGTR